MTELTIQLPEPLATQLKHHPQENPAETVADVLNPGLQERFQPKDLAKLLELSGIVTDAPRGAAEQAEDFEDAQG